MLYEYNVDSVKITHMTVCCTWQAAERRRLGRSTAEQYHGRGRAARVSAGTRSSRTRTRTSATTCRRRRWPPPSTSVAIRIRGIRRVRGATRWIRTSAGSTAMCRSAASDAFLFPTNELKHTRKLNFIEIHSSFPVLAHRRCFGKSCGFGVVWSIWS